MKELFRKWVNKIENKVLRNACIEMIDLLPNYFWQIPASSSGKYHPTCDLGEGGLVRHSVMVCQCALDLITSEIFIPDTQLNRDIAIMAALFHDGWKSGLENENGEHSPNTVHEHPIIASTMVQNYLIKRNEKNHGNEEELISEEIIKTVAEAIYSHMGKWITSKHSSFMLRKPETDFEKLIHAADYVASRKYIAGLDDWNQ